MLEKANMLKYDAKVLNYFEDREAPINSPSYISKYLDNMKGLSDDRANKVYKNYTEARYRKAETDSVAMLALGLITHTGMDWINELVREHNFERNEKLYNTVWSELTERYEFTEAEAENISAVALRDRVERAEVIKQTWAEAKVMLWRILEGFEWDTIRTEVKTNVLVVNGNKYQGTIDLIQDNEDGTFTLIDLKNYNGESEEDIKYWFNQLRIYGAIASAMGLNIVELKVYNPVTDNWFTQEVSNASLEHWARNYL